MPQAETEIVRSVSPTQSGFVEMDLSKMIETRFRRATAGAQRDSSTRHCYLSIPAVARRCSSASRGRP